MASDDIHTLPTTFILFSSSSPRNLIISFPLFPVLIGLLGLVLLTYGARIIKPVFRIFGFLFFALISIFLSDITMDSFDVSENFKQITAAVFGFLGGILGVYFSIILLKALMFIFYVALLTIYFCFLGSSFDSFFQMSNPYCTITFGIIGFILSFLLAISIIKDKIKFKKITMIFTSLFGAFLLTFVISVSGYISDIPMLSLFFNLAFLFGYVYQYSVSCKGFDVVNPLNEEFIGSKDPVLPKSVKGPVFGSI